MLHDGMVSSLTWRGVYTISDEVTLELQHRNHEALLDKTDKTLEYIDKLFLCS